MFGMVLGVDDFCQEYVYLVVCDECVLCEIFGYGVIIGLGVFVFKLLLISDGQQVCVVLGLVLMFDGYFVGVVVE